jgi:hypothetical protein
MHHIVYTRRNQAMSSSSFGWLEWALVTKPPQEWGIRPPRSYRGILYEAIIRKHNTSAYNTMIFKLKSSYYSLSAMYEVYRRWSQKSASKDWTEFSVTGFLSHQAHTLHHRREWIYSDDLHLWVPVGTTLIGVAGRRKILTCTQDKNNKSKAWATTLSKTYMLCPEGHKTEHAKTSKVVLTQAYLQLLLISCGQNY